MSALEIVHREEETERLAEYEAHKRKITEELKQLDEQYVFEPRNQKPLINFSDDYQTKHRIANWVEEATSQLEEKIQKQPITSLSAIELGQQSKRCTSPARSTHKIIQPRRPVPLPRRSPPSSIRIYPHHSHDEPHLQKHDAENTNKYPYTQTHLNQLSQFPKSCFRPSRRIASRSPDRVRYRDRSPEHTAGRSKTSPVSR